MKNKKDNKTNRLKHIAYLLGIESIDTIRRNLEGKHGSKSAQYLVKKLYNMPNLFLIDDLADLDNESN